MRDNYRAELVFILQQELGLYDLHQQQIAAWDEQIEQCLLRFNAKPDQSPPDAKNKRRKTPQNAPAFDLRGQLY